MEKNMQINFKYLDKRVLDALDKTDLEFIRFELSKIKEPTLVSGVGGSSVVSDFTARVLEKKNGIIAQSREPRDFAYASHAGFKNVIACSYSGNNHGVKLAFDNDLKHYLLSNNCHSDPEVTNLKYDTEIDRERSFISLGASLIPISILLNYYLNGNQSLIEKAMNKCRYSFEVDADAFEIFSGFDTSTTAKYLESTMVEAGIGIPIVHDKYSYCHGRSTLSTCYNNIAIYLNRGTELDEIILEDLPKYYRDVIVLQATSKNPILGDYQMLWQAMYLTKYMAEQKEVDLSGVENSPVTKKLYTFQGQV